MVQLVRLTTDDDNARFDNLFNQAIEVKPKSKIALVNLSCEVNTSEFTINTSNNLLEYQIRNGFIKNCFLNKGTYDKSTIDILLNDMTIKLNSAVSLDGAEYGKQFKAQIKDSKINIITGLGTNANYETDQVKKNVASTAAGILNRNGGTVGDTDSFLFLNKAMSKGSGAVKIRLHREPSANGFILGITSTPLNSSLTEIDLNTLNYAIKVIDDVSPIQVGQNVGGTLTFTNTGELTHYVSAGSPNNDEYFIMIDEGKIKLKRYNGTGANDLLYQTNYNGTTDYYPVLIFLGDSSTDAVRVSNFRFTPDPFYSSVATTADTSEDVLTSPSQSTGNALKSQHFFRFGDPLLAEYLGFVNDRIPKVGTTVQENFNIEADKQFKPSDLSESYIVELTNINLNSYDGATNQRRNILSTLVNTTIDNDRVSYIAPYPLYIDIDNSTPLLLKNIRARILKEDGAPITVNGLSQMTLLISD